MNNIIATDKELKTLFPDEEQRQVFMKILERIIKEISQRTVDVPFVHLIPKENS